MGKTCLVTGGAGFIGCALSSRLVQLFDDVIAVDILHPQIHLRKDRPADLYDGVKLTVADVCVPQTWDELLPKIENIDTIVDLAAETGTAQSLSDASRHAVTNVVGTTQLLDGCVRNRKMPRQIFLASSRAIYGEGAWKRNDGSIFYPGQRADEQLLRGEWDFPNAKHMPFSAKETKPSPTSIYGATKLAQENILSAWTKSYGVQLKTVRLQNVYGPGQSLINSYTGIVSYFVRLAKEGKPIPLYEDGNIIRDFVFIDDVVRGILMALCSDNADGKIYDIGTGKETTLAEVADIIAKRYGAPSPQIRGQYRNGDVRHASCDLTNTMDELGFFPEYTIEQGIEKLCRWIDAQ